MFFNKLLKDLTNEDIGDNVNDDEVQSTDDGQINDDQTNHHNHDPQALSSPFSPFKQRTNGTSTPPASSTPTASPTHKSTIFNSIRAENGVPSGIQLFPPTKDADNATPINTQSHQLTESTWTSLCDLAHEVEEIVFDSSKQSQQQNGPVTKPQLRSWADSTPDEVVRFLLAECDDLKKYTRTCESRVWQTVASVVGYPLPSNDKPIDVHVKGRELLLTHLGRLHTTQLSSKSTPSHIAVPSEDKAGTAPVAQKTQISELPSGTQGLIRELQQAEAEARQNAETNLRQLTLIRQQWEQDREVNERAKAELQGFFVEAERAKQKIQKELAVANNEIEAALKENQKVQTEREEALKELAYVKRQLQRLQQENRQKEESLSGTEIRRQSEASKTSQLEQKVGALEAEVESLNERLVDKSRELEMEQKMVENLTTVLQDFQDEQRQILDRLKQQFNNQMAGVQQEAETKLEAELVKRATEIGEVRDRQVAVLQKELDSAKLQTQQLQAEVTRVNNMLRGTMDRMRDSKVIDRQLVNSLMVTYVSKPNQRDDVLNVMSKILEWDDATKEAVGINQFLRCCV
eukprot:c12939_g2_i2.p1 GENE.c12939_g2_i2~~c12939_g2_i2.p1  ORF type:complete len:576 (-),score=168.44 c12939_g2_i2:142-1869(-)